MLKSEFNELENFVEFIETSSKKLRKNQKDVTGIHTFIKGLSNELVRINYFKFIPISSSKESQAKVKLAIDMHSLLKYYQFQSYIIGFNCLFLTLIFIKSRNVFGFSSLNSILMASLFTFLTFRYNYNKIFYVMDNYFKNDIIDLYDKIKRGDDGFTNKLEEDLAKADEVLKSAEQQKFDEKNVYKNEYLNKTYTIEQREKLLDLIDFYGEWLYSPVDEELENKIYFLDFDRKSKHFENVIYNKLKVEIDAMGFEEKTNSDLVYGIRIKNNKI